jgi:hypothetical protein
MTFQCVCAYALALGTLAAGPACTSTSPAPCESVCNASIKCPGNSQATDCTAECAAYNSINTAGDCTSLYDDLLACEEGLSNVCDQSSCESAGPWLTCARTVCLGNTATSACASLGSQPK